MITGFFIVLITAIVSALVGLLPFYDLPSGWLESVATVWGLANTMGFLLPLSTLVHVLTIAIFLNVTVFVWHLSLKVYRMIRGGGA